MGASTKLYGIIGIDNDHAYHFSILFSKRAIAPVFSASFLGISL
jgi:hypothetical protein